MSAFLVEPQTDNMAGAPFVQREMAGVARGPRAAGAGRRPYSRVRLALIAAAALVAAATAVVASEIAFVTQTDQARGVMDGE